MFESKPDLLYKYSFIIQFGKMQRNKQINHLAYIDPEGSHQGPRCKIRKGNSLSSLTLTEGVNPDGVNPESDHWGKCCLLLNKDRKYIFK